MPPHDRSEAYSYTPAKQMFLGVYWNQSVCVSVCWSCHVSVCVQSTSFCQSAGGSIKSHSRTALLFAPSVCLYFHKKTNIGHNFCMVSDRTCIFHMCILWGKTFPLAPRLKSSVRGKVKNHGCTFQKFAVAGAFMFHKHRLLAQLCT